MSTQKQECKYAVTILTYPLKIDGKLTSLSNYLLPDLKKQFYNELRHKRLERLKNDGKKGTAIVNLETTFFRSAITWALSNISELPQMLNPLIGIKPFKSKGNTRYVTDTEFNIQIKEAAHIIDWLPVFIRITYLLGTRGVETCNIRESHLLDVGIDVKRRKGSKNNIIAWNDSVRKAVKQANQLTASRKLTNINPYLITNTEGKKISQSAIQSAMGRLKKHMIAKGMADIFWTLHKTKSKAQSDSSDDRISGLKSDSMKALYNTKNTLLKQA